MKAICRLGMFALCLAWTVAHAADPMIRATGPNTGIRDMVVAAAPAPDPGRYVCSIEVIGAMPDRPYGALQFSLTPDGRCAGQEETFVAYITVDDVSARSAGSDPAYTEAHVLAMQQALLTAAREGWRVWVEHNPGFAIVKKVTIRLD